MHWKTSSAFLRMIYMLPIVRIGALIYLSYSFRLYFQPPSGRPPYRPVLSALYSYSQIPFDITSFTSCITTFGICNRHSVLRLPRFSKYFAAVLKPVNPYLSVSIVFCYALTFSVSRLLCLAFLPKSFSVPLLQYPADSHVHSFLLLLFFSLILQISVRFFIPWYKGTIHEFNVCIYSSHVFVDMIGITFCSFLWALEQSQVSVGSLFL